MLKAQRAKKAPASAEGLRRSYIGAIHWSYALECKELLSNSEIVTYIPSYQDIYSNDEDEQVYIARIIQDNLGRIPVVV